MVSFPITGKCSEFGGPNDPDVGPKEGLALVQAHDLNEWWFSRCFLDSTSYNQNLGLARNLDPDAFYCAMRWNELGILPEVARRTLFKIKFNGRQIFVQPVDYGPGDGKVVDGVQDLDTHRLIDLSPGALEALGAQTDDIVTVDIVR